MKLINQCDGCRAGMPLHHKDIHVDEAGHAVMVCQKERYAAQPTLSEMEKRQ